MGIFKYLAAIAIIVFVVFVIAKFGGLLSVGTVQGMLIASISSVTFESNQQDIANSNYIITAILNGGPDKLFGTATLSSQDLQNASGFPSDAKITRDFTISGSKLKNLLIIPFVQQNNQPVYVDTFYRVGLDITGSGLSSSYCVFGCPYSSKDAAIRDLTLALYSECKNSKGTNFAGHGWYVETEENCAGGFGAKCARVYSGCFFKIPAYKISDFDTDHPQYDWAVKFDVTGKTTESVTITSADNWAAKPFSYGTIGFLRNSLGNVPAPILATQYYPTMNLTTNTWQTLKGDPQLYKSELGRMSAGGSFYNYSSTENWGAIYGQRNYVNRLLEGSDGLASTTNAQYGASHNISSGRIEFPLDSGINPEFQITMKAAFVGIERNVPAPSLACTGNNFSVPSSEYGAVSLAVTNNSDIGGAINLSHNCTGAITAYLEPNVPSQMYSPRETKNYLFKITSGNIGTYACQIKAVATAYGSVESQPCNINANFTTVRVCGDKVCEDYAPYFEANPASPNYCPADCGTCGNGIIDAGENCATCSQDVKCGTGKYCDIPTQTCKTAPPSCPNEIAQPEPPYNENCLNCPQDVKCGLNEYCNSQGVCVSGGQDYTIWIIAAILAIIAIVLGYYLVVKK